MAIDNHVTLTGNLTRDPELRYTPSGAGVAQFGLAVNRRIKRGDSWEDETSFFDVTCWNSLAENIAASVTKGARVVVEGRLQQDTWEDKTSGEARSKVIVVADEIGASMRWAEVVINRNERTTPSGQQGDPGPKEPAGYAPGEEPF